MFISIINASIAAVWLILAVLILRAVLRKVPRWTICLLWGLVGLRLLMPFSVKSIFSLIPSTQTLPSTIEYDTIPQINSGVPLLNDSINPILADNFAATPQYSANPMQILLAIGGMIWTLGMLVMVLYLAVSFIVLRIKMNTATLLRDNIYQSERVQSPFVMGIIRPRIYIPYGMDEKTQSHVLAHEQAHIRKGDNIIKPAAFLVLTLHWFNPFVWLAYILLCRDIEVACDQRVIRSLSSAERKEYSRALVTAGSDRRALSACPLAFGEVGIKARVKSVLSYKKPALWVIIAAVAVCAVTALCFLTDPVERPVSIFGKNYAETRLIYQSPYLSSIGKPSREYHFTADERAVLLADDGEQNLGRLTSMELTRQNFEEMFFQWSSDVEDGLWPGGISPVQLRRENSRAWYLTSGSDMICVLLQNSGEVYIAYGHYASAEELGKSEFYRVFLMEEMSMEKPSDLDAALNKAAIDRNKGGYLSGQFRCSAHTILGTECEQSSGDTRRLTAYAIVRYEEFSLVDGVPEGVSGSSCPVAVTFDISSGGEYTLVEYWEPEDGTLYAGSLKEKFPSNIPWNTEIGRAERQNECLRQACEYFDVPMPDLSKVNDEDTVPTTATAVNTGAKSAAYTYKSKFDIFGDCTLTLSGDGTAVLSFGYLSSYVAHGTYKIDADTLLLTTDDGFGNEYVFRISGDGYVFDAENSAVVPKFKPSAESDAVYSLPNGAQFRPTE